MGHIPGRYLLNISVSDDKLQTILAPNKVSASAVEDKFVRNDVSDSINGKLFAVGLDSGFQKVTGVLSGTAANDAINVSQLQGLQVSLSWRMPVDEQALSPSGGEVGNDGWRVLINGVGSGVFASHNNDIATWDDTGSSWSFLAPEANWALFDKATDNAYTYDDTGVMWIQFNGAGQIIDGDGLLKTGNTLDVYITDLVGHGVENDGANNIRISTSAAGHGLSGGGGTGIYVDASEVAGVGLEDDGAESIRLAEQGDGIGGGVGSLLNVEDDIVGGANLSRSVNVSSNGVAVKIDDATIGEGISNRLEVKNNSIDENKITSSAAGNGLSGGNGFAITILSDPIGGVNLSRSIGVSGNGVAIKVDDDTIGEGTLNRLKVKSAGVHFSNLDVAADPGIEDGGSDTLRIKIKTLGGINRDSDGLSINASELQALGVNYRRSDFYSINATDILNGYFFIPREPTYQAEVTLIIIGGGAQTYGTDYTVDAGNKRIDMLAPLLNIAQNGDVAHIIYASNE